MGGSCRGKPTRHAGTGLPLGLTPRHLCLCSRSQLLEDYAPENKQLAVEGIVATASASLETIEDFLARKRIAMAGISRDPANFSVKLFEVLSPRI